MSADVMALQGAWYQTGNKPLAEQMMTMIIDHINQCQLDP